ncbi:hypothetical protein COV89_04105 [Candidatus Shapirobacteria bacterium CG11_big_fil_rev_8_21_14_0_20_40_12]|uniref:Cytidyltransferase-like domain-containing protein n=3 Tax=Candidatus Shapironibacteriota TaxID=1752721 RepID=A0A2M8EW13_9BACT|nr:MAG: hypothetical protein COV89_04105 [Candidatus Shapirobacteria bacterium CG11_big_fil_rev_8_21_14_0_20_40_12]PJC29298.1 MAG: hypothetical protein CO053_00220 [Candidatus Shapirobacteria bacterium CG_4_9_14_0_2_um_filter_40_11]PJC75883.1 MAG: hypothetical protein CO010_04135 [Candidatus Shapirobacteria bacterium CG_4_8_14_3_um_filter_39_11]
MGKIKEFHELTETCRSLRKKGKKIGLVTGCFDVFHIGHVKFLEFARSQVDCLIVGLESDNSIKVNKGQGRPIFKYLQRAEVLASLRVVDFIFEIKNNVKFDSNNPPKVYLSILEQLRPYALISSPCDKKYLENKKKDAEKVGAKLILFHKNLNISSTETIKKIKLLN